MGPVEEQVAAVLPLVVGVGALGEGDAVALGPDAGEQVVSQDPGGDPPLVEPAGAAEGVGVEGVGEPPADRRERAWIRGREACRGRASAGRPTPPCRLPCRMSLRRLT